MGSNLILFGWNRSIPGREQTSADHFAEFVQYLGGLQQRGTIQAFEIVFLDPHGGDLNGFFLMRGEPSKLDALVGSHDWITHTVRAMLHLQGFGAVRGVTGAGIMERMELWTRVMPQGS